MNKKISPEKANTFNADSTDKEKLLHDFKPLILASITRYYQKEERDDLIQDGYEQILIALKDYNGQSALPYYLKMRLKYYYLNRNRDKKEIAVDTAALAETLPDLTDTPEEKAVLGADVQKLYRAIDKLSPMQQTVIRRHDLGGETLSELAAKLGLQYGTVAKHRQRALKMLKKQLDTPSACRDNF